MNASTFRPRKSLGQNFLVDENIARKIVETLTPKPKDVVVEIGPGFGVLTKYLVPRVRQVLAVEIDRRLTAGLREAFADATNFQLVEGDFLDVDLTALARAWGRLRVLGNIPYHITSPVIFKVLRARDLVQDLTLMIQKEVALRVVAAPGGKDYGILSVYSQLFAEPRILFHVSRNVFKPRPDVDSSVVRWDFPGRHADALHDERVFDQLVHVAFQQRRKMLRKSLRSVPEFAERLERLDFDLQKRPEQLSPLEFVELSNALSEHG